MLNSEILASFPLIIRLYVFVITITALNSLMSMECLMQVKFNVVEDLSFEYFLDKKYYLTSSIRFDVLRANQGVVKSQVIIVKVYFTFFASSVMKLSLIKANF